MKTTPLPQSQLNARAIIAGDLYREGRIHRGECFRLEMDAALGRDSGPIQFEPNQEYAELQAEVMPPRLRASA